LVQDPLRPEFTQHIVTDIEREAVPDSPCGVRGTVLVAWVIDVAQRSRTRASQPLGIVEGAGSVVGLSNKQVCSRVNYTLPDAAAAEAVVSWVFEKDRWIGKMLEKFGSHGICEICAIAPAVSRGALPEHAVPVRRVIESRVERRADHVHRVSGFLKEKAELIGEFKRTTPNAWLVTGRVDRLSFKRARKYSNRLLKWAVIIADVRKRGRLRARRRSSLESLILEGVLG